MPKLGVNYKSGLSISVTDDLKEKLWALAYMKDYGGVINKVARDIMIKAVDAIIRKMEPLERRQFDDIRKNVRAQMAIQRQEMGDKKTQTSVMEETQEPNLPA